MIATHGISLRFSGRKLFDDVNVKFTPGNCYGVIGANGAGKSTFLKILAGELEPNQGSIEVPSNQRLAVLRQDQFAFDDFTVFDTVVMGFPRLYEIMKAREALYAKSDFSEEDGIKAGELEGDYADMGGYEAEAEVGTLLDGLGISTEYHGKQMSELEGGEKVRVLLAQALFGKPDILLLDEPTNNLDVNSIIWLEDYLQQLSESVVIVVSHDRHFLNNVCTHIADIDFGKIRVYVGNYDFWQKASQLMIEQMRDSNKKKSDRIKELKSFISRFSSNASKAKQATSRKKLLDKLELDDLPISNRKYPHIVFTPERECGRSILRIDNLSASVDGTQVIRDFSLTVNQGEKIAFVGPDGQSRTTLFQILAGELEPDSGTIEWGQTITRAYFPRDNSDYFDTEKNLIDWLRQYSDDQSENYVRGFLGRMLFSGDETLKPANVLSGGEKVRCMLSRMMLSKANFLIFDEPTNHLDLESITALNEGMQKFDDVILFASHDRELVDTVGTRIIELTPFGYIDQMMPYQEYLEREDIKAKRAALYH